MENTNNNKLYLLTLSLSISVKNIHGYFYGKLYILLRKKNQYLDGTFLKNENSLLNWENVHVLKIYNNVGLFIEAFIVSEVKVCARCVYSLYLFAEHHQENMACVRISFSFSLYYQMCLL